MHKDLKKLIRRLAYRGWEYEVGRKHIKLRLGDQLVSVSITPSCPFFINHVIADVKRAERVHREGR